MQITVNEQDIIKAAGEGMDAFLMLFHDRIMEAIGGRLDAETMPLLNGEQITLLAYVALIISCSLTVICIHLHYI